MHSASQGLPFCEAELKWLKIICAVHSFHQTKTRSPAEQLLTSASLDQVPLSGKGGMKRWVEGMMGMCGGLITC